MDLLWSPTEEVKEVFVDSGSDVKRIIREFEDARTDLNGKLQALQHASGLPAETCVLRELNRRASLAKNNLGVATESTEATGAVPQQTLQSIRKLTEILAAEIRSERKP